jgi:hypothetical protein
VSSRPAASSTPAGEREPDTLQPPRAVTPCSATARSTAIGTLRLTIGVPSKRSETSIAPPPLPTGAASAKR